MSFSYISVFKMSFLGLSTSRKSQSLHIFSCLFQIRFYLLFHLQPLSITVLFFHLAMESSVRSKRPSANIYSITTYNRSMDKNNWLQQSIQKGCWVLMQERRRRKMQVQNKFLRGWKGIVKDFRFGTNKKTIKEILVQHAFMHKELCIDISSSKLPRHRPNCEFHSFFF